MRSKPYKSTPEAQLKQRLAEVSKTRAEDWFLVSRARHGMEVVLRQVAKGEVVTQAFTCITAVNPILMAGHKPVYADISEDTLSIDTASLGELLNNNTKAVVVQHTFGLVGDVAGAAKVVSKKSPDALLIEDSAHCLGMMASVGGRPVADVSVHSFGAEKFLASRFGAAIWVNPDMSDAVLRGSIAEALSGLPNMSLVSSLQARLYPLFNAIFNRLPVAVAQPLRRLTTASRLFVAPIMPVEQQGKNYGMPEKPASWVTRQMIELMANYEKVYKHRTEIASIYAKGLKRVNIPLAVRRDKLPYVRFPVILDGPQKAEVLFEKLRSKHMNPGKWYRPLLFPGAADPSIYEYDSKSSPVAESVAARIVNLPTGMGVTAARAKEIIDEING